MVRFHSVGARNARVFLSGSIPLLGASVVQVHISVLSLRGTPPGLFTICLAPANHATVLDRSHRVYFCFLFFSFATAGANPADGFANRMNSVKKGFSALLRCIAY